MGEEKSVPVWLFGCFAFALGLSMFLFYSAEFRCVELSERYDSAMDRLYEAEREKGHCYTCSAHTRTQCYTCERYACRKCCIMGMGHIRNASCQSCREDLAEINDEITKLSEKYSAELEVLKVRRQKLIEGLPKQREELHPHVQLQEM